MGDNFLWVNSDHKDGNTEHNDDERGASASADGKLLVFSTVTFRVSSCLHIVNSLVFPDSSAQIPWPPSKQWKITLLNSIYNTLLEINILKNISKYKYSTCWSLSHSMNPFLHQGSLKQCLSNYHVFTHVRSLLVCCPHPLLSSLKSENLVPAASLQEASPSSKQEVNMGGCPLCVTCVKCGIIWCPWTEWTAISTKYWVVTPEKSQKY